MTDTAWYKQECAFIRQFTRAVLADQFTGDEVARAALSGFDPAAVIAETDRGRRLAVFRAFFDAWRDAGNGEGNGNFSDRSLLASAPLRADKARQLLLLVDVLNISLDSAAELLELRPANTKAMLAAERRKIEHKLQGRALVIEDEPVIAMDVASVLEKMGLDVVGSARTKFEAVSLAQQEKPDLLLADYNLGAGGSGLDAVKEISSEMPVITVFLTAFPDDVLVGDDYEPAFILPKPFEERALRAAVAHGLEAPRTGTIE